MTFRTSDRPSLRLVLSLLAALYVLASIPVASAAEPRAARLVAAERIVIIEARWSGKWFQAHIIERKTDPTAGTLYKIHYEHSLSDTDEWVAADKLRTVDGGPLPEPTPSAEDVANAARDQLTGNDYFVGTWGLAGVPVVNVVKSEKLGDGKTSRETRQMQGGGDRGYLRINADGTFVWAGGVGGKSSGRWRVDTNKNHAGDLILEKADRVIGDAFVHREGSGVISVQKGRGGPSSRGGLVHDDRHLVMVGNVGTEFFLGMWLLTRPRGSALLKSDYGSLDIRADGTFTHVDGAKTTTGKWHKPDATEAMILVEPWGEGDFRFKQQGATSNISGQGVTQTHIGVYAKRPEPK